MGLDVAIKVNTPHRRASILVLHARGSCVQKCVLDCLVDEPEGDNTKDTAVLAEVAKSLCPFGRAGLGEDVTREFQPLVKSIVESDVLLATLGPQADIQWVVWPVLGPSKKQHFC